MEGLFHLSAGGLQNAYTFLPTASSKDANFVGNYSVHEPLQR